MPAPPTNIPARICAAMREVATCRAQGCCRTLTSLVVDLHELLAQAGFGPVATFVTTATAAVAPHLPPPLACVSAIMKSCKASGRARSPGDPTGNSIDRFEAEAGPSEA